MRSYTPGGDIAFMLDQCHNIEPKIPAQIRSVLNVQEASAKALLVDADALAAAQRAGDVLGGLNGVLMDAYNTDVRPLLAEVREEMGLDRIRTPLTPGPVTRKRSWRNGSVGPRPAGETAEFLFRPGVPGPAEGMTLI